jgi:polyisoprenoid-binding protein YceI
MKPFLVFTAAAAIVTFASCGPTEAEIAATKAKATADSLAAEAAKEKTWTIDAASSKVNWAGTMVGVYTHSGTIGINEGSLMTKGDMLSGGSFVINMKSITPTDSNYNAKEKKTPEGLVGHLSSPDFFAVDSFPTAALKIVSVEGNTAKADLTIRNKTNSETITDIVLTPNADGTVHATGKLVFDRQKYGVAWKASMKDMVLQDNIELTVDLTGKAQ